MDINEILAYRNKIFNAAIIIVAILVSINMYRGQLQIIESLRQTKDMEVKKNTIVGSIGELEKRVKLYKEFVNKKDPLSLIKTFNRIARESGVNITSLKPDRQQEFPMYTKYPYIVMINASSFGQLGKFISKLESSPDIYFIDTAEIRSTGPVAPGSGKESMTMNLVASTIIFK